MRLITYMKRNAVTPRVIALSIAKCRGYKVSAPEISRWVNGVRRPSRPNREAIRRATNGAVGMRDW